MIVPLLCCAFAFYMGGATAVLPILSDAVNEDGEPIPTGTAVRLALCWPLHPWRNG